jgi:hypothetical protein
MPREPELPADLTGTAASVARVLGVYHRLLSERRLVEPSEAAGLLADRAGELPLPSVIAVNRFTGLTSAQERFIVAAAQTCDTIISLTYDPDVPATHAAAGLVERLGRHGTVEVGAGQTTTREPELVVLERRLGAFGTPEPSAVSTGAVRLIDAWGEEAEAAGIVAEVQYALADGVEPGEIAVVFRDPARHLDVLEAAFAESEIDVAYDLLVPAPATGLGRVLGILDALFLGTGRRSDMLGFLRSPYSGVSPSRLDSLDLELRTRRESGGEALVAAVAGILGPKAARTIVDAHDVFTADLDSSAPAKWAALLGRMLAAAHGTGVVLGLPGLLDAGVMQAAVRAVTEMTSGGGERFTVREAVALIAETKVATPVPADGLVRVVGADRVRGRRFRCVVLGGLTAGEFPSSAGEDVLSVPSVARQLEKAGVPPKTRVDVPAERLLFYQVATRARERLVLCRQVADEEGGAVRPSVFVEELLDLYFGHEDPRDRTGGPPRRVLTQEDAMVGGLGPTNTRRSLRASVISGGGEGPRLAHARYRARGGLRSECESVAAAMGARSVFSASEIERYLQCPYHWYANGLVQVAAIDAELDTGVAGRTAHAILERFYARFGEDGHARVTPENLDIAVSTHDEVAEAVVAEVVTVGLAEELTVRAVVGRTRQTVKSDAAFLPGFRPLSCEWSFGFGDDPPHDFGEFSLRGRIDRIDTDGGGLVVIDYKSGSVAELGVPQFQRRGLVQLPLYAIVASDRLGLSVSGGLYRTIGSSAPPRGFALEPHLATQHLVSTDRLSDDGLAEVLAGAVARAEAAVCGMRQGRIPAERAPGRKCPTYCPVLATCGGSEVGYD